MMRLNSKTRPVKTREITIQPVKDMQGDFIAYYKSEMLAATYSVYFKDNIMGALALNAFYEMIKQKYQGQIDFYVEKQELQFKSKALLDVLSSRS